MDNSKLEVQELKNNPKFTEYLYYLDAGKLQPSITQRDVVLMTKIENGINRIYIQAAAGSGKTLMSLLAEVSNYRKKYSQYYIKFGIVKKICIFGFLSTTIFKREMLKFPELGYITQSELDELKEIRKNISNTRGESVHVFEQNYSNLYNKIARRIVDPNYEGFFVFYGYRKWFLHLFTTDDLPEEITPENVFRAYKDGKVKCNQKLLDSFKNSLIICDEIHMTYNTLEANTYCIALQMLLDYHGDNITAIFLSATPVNNQRREIIDLANLMRSQNQPGLLSENFFKSDGTEKSDLQPIVDRFIGKMIFLEEKSSDYPEIKYMGEKSYGIDNNVYSIPMSPLHQHTFEKLGLDTGTTQHVIINDMVYPNPAFSVEDHLKWHPDHPEHSSRNMDMVGLIDKTFIEESYLDAPKEWLNGIGIKIESKADYMNIGGDWLDKENLKIYSAKYYKMIDEIETQLKKNPLQKFLMLHPRIQGSGVNQITSILVQNGFIEYGKIPNKKTYSSSSFVQQKDWKNVKGKKTFKPATVFAVKFDVNANKQKRMFELWNSVSEKYGSSIKIVVGAKKIIASVDSKNTPHVFMLQVFDNKAERIQATGRIVRNSSMQDLPSDQRIAHIHTFMSTSNVPGQMTIEQKRYIRQDREYSLIRKLLRQLNIHAVNNPIYGKDFREEDGLGSLSFPRNFKPPNEINMSTYFDKNYEYALSFFNIIIKRAFIAQNVWTEKNLWDFVVNNPATTVYLDGVNKTVKPIYERMFKYVLSNLIYSKSVNIYNTQFDIFDPENKIFDKYVLNGKVKKSVKKAVTRIGEYYVLCPLDRYGNLEIYPGSYLRKKKKIIIESTLIKLSSEDKIDTNYISKYMEKYKKNRKNLMKENKHYLFLKEFEDSEHYSMMKKHICDKYILPDELFSLYRNLGVAGDDFFIDNEYTHRYENKTWNQYPKPAKPEREENDILVGNLSNKRFKIREPTDENFNDKRKIRSGQTATTVKKDLLLKYYKSLYNISMRSNINTITLSDGIFIKLLDLEMVSRKTKNGKIYLSVFE